MTGDVGQGSLGLDLVRFAVDLGIVRVSSFRPRDTVVGRLWGRESRVPVLASESLEWVYATGALASTAETEGR